MSDIITVVRFIGIALVVSGVVVALIVVVRRAIGAHKPAPLPSAAAVRPFRPDMTALICGRCFRPIEANECPVVNPNRQQGGFVHGDEWCDEEAGA